MKRCVNTPNNGTLNLRDAPNGSAPILARIPFGTTLEVTQINSDWSQTIYKNMNGYVMNKFLSSSNTIITKDDLRTIYNSLKSTLETIENVLK